MNKRKSLKYKTSQFRKCVSDFLCIISTVHADQKQIRYHFFGWFNHNFLFDDITSTSSTQLDYHNDDNNNNKINHYYYEMWLTDGDGEAFDEEESEDCCGFFRGTTQRR